MSVDSIPTRVLEIPVGTPIAEVERALILATLDHYWGNKRKAAEELGISLKTLYLRLHRYGLPVKLEDLRDALKGQPGGDAA